MVFDFRTSKQNSLFLKDNSSKANFSISEMIIFDYNSFINTLKLYTLS